MHKIVCGVVLERVTVPGAYDVRTFQANGVMERSVRPRREWREVTDLEEFQRRTGTKLVTAADYERWGWNPPPSVLEQWEREAEERRERKAEQNAMRAKTACRRLIIAENFNELLTLTYRENQEDRALCKKHFKEWVRRMKTAIPGFRYCASFERQERGSMHVHLATHKLPQHVTYKGAKIQAWKLGTAVWRSVVGRDNGLCFVGGSTRFGGKRRNLSLAKMAGYVSKYIMKDWADVPPGSNRYSRSVGVPSSDLQRRFDGRPATGLEHITPTTMSFTGLTYAEVIALAFELGEGDVLHSWSVNPLMDSMWMVTEGRRAA